MSSSTTTNLDQEIVRESLECPICKDFFVEPKQLLCGHTFCQGCIDGLDRVNSLSIGGGDNDNNGILFTAYSTRSSEARRCLNVRLNANQTRYSIMCPNCRKMSLIPETGLNTNYVVKELVEKFRYICVNGIDSTNSSVPGEKSPCNGCNRQTPTNELFFCKTCATNGFTNTVKSPNTSNDSILLSPFANGNKKFICSLCVIKQHKDHNVVMCSDFASVKDREEAVNLIADAACRARSYVEQMKSVKEEFVRGFDNIQQKLQYSLEPFEQFHIQCYDNDSHILKEELEETVRKAKQLSDRFSMTYNELDKVNKDASRLFRSISLIPDFDHPKRPRFPQFFDSPGGPSTSSASSFNNASNYFSYQPRDGLRSDRTHKRKPRRSRLNLADPRLARSPGQDTTADEDIDITLCLS